MEPFLGEIRMFALPFVPKGWAACNGQILQISQNQALFAILNTSFGGDGKTTFALPDLSGRTPVCIGQNAHATSYAVGDKFGSASVALAANEMPSHTHTVVVDPTENSQTPAPTGNLLAKVHKTLVSTINIYSTDGSALVALNAATIGYTGAGERHNNMQPYAVASFCIAVVGVYPSQY